MAQVGDSPYVQFNSGSLPKFVISSITWHSQSGNEEFTVKPFRGKPVALHEWYRNENALHAPVPPRQEMATFTEINPEAPVFYSNPTKPDFTYRQAIFHSMKDGTTFDCSENAMLLCIPKGLKPGDEVMLTISGCCSIVDMKKSSGTIEEIKPKHKKKSTKTKTKNKKK